MCCAITIYIYIFLYTSCIDIYSVYRVYIYMFTHNKHYTKLRYIDCIHIVYMWVWAKPMGTLNVAMDPPKCGQLLGGFNPSEKDEVGWRTCLDKLKGTQLEPTAMDWKLGLLLYDPAPGVSWKSVFCYFQNHLPNSLFLGGWGQCWITSPFITFIRFQYWAKRSFSAAPRKTGTRPIQQRHVCHLPSVAWCDPRHRQVDFRSAEWPGSYGGWLRNPAPLGWLKPYKQWDVYHSFQLVQDFATIHSRDILMTNPFLAPENLTDPTWSKSVDPTIRL